MALPPDDRRPTPGEASDEPISDEPSSDQPTIAWTPPEPPPIDPSADAAPDADAAPPAEPASPLISWAPSGGAPVTPPAGAPLVGWQVPDNAARPSPIAGFAVASVGARFVAYLIDGLLIAIANSAILAVVAPGVSVFDPTTQIDQFTVPVFTLETLLAGVIGIGLDFIYLVGLWTSRGRATISQRTTA